MVLAGDIGVGVARQAEWVRNVQNPDDARWTMLRVGERLLGMGYTPERVYRLTGTRLSPAEPERRAELPKWQAVLPVQSSVNRSAQLQASMVDTPVFDDKGQVLLILRNPVGGPYGPVPGDPAWFRPVGPLNMCAALTGNAVARCMLGSRR